MDHSFHERKIALRAHADGLLKFANFHTTGLDEIADLRAHLVARLVDWVAVSPVLGIFLAHSFGIIGGSRPLGACFD